MSQKKARESLTYEELAAFFAYDPVTGWITYKIPFGKRRQLGQRVGSTQPNGWKLVKYKNATIVSTHLIWFLMTKRWPKEEIDHKNQRRDDDRWENLREATRAQNCQNRRRRKSALGLRGVKIAAPRNGKPRYSATITANRADYFLGYFDTPESAARAYDVGARKHFGEFAVLNFPEVVRDWLYV